MRYLLHSFIAFGCRNRDFLVAVAKSPDHVIEDFLKRMVNYAPPAQAYDVLSEMEVWVLKHHFRKFFSQELRAGENAS